jgi:hypothetical protein
LNADDQAAHSFQTAIQAAPDFAEAYANLAAIRAHQGKAEQAATLQREAVRHAPTSQRHRNTLTAYEALLVGGCSSDAVRVPEVQMPSVGGGNGPTLSSGFPDLASRIEGLNWPQLDSGLAGHGLAHAEGLLRADECETLWSMFDKDGLFAKTVTMNKSRFGKGVYRYFAAPIPSLVDAIRRLAYPHLAEIANRWQRLLDDDDRTRRPGPSSAVAAPRRGRRLRRRCCCVTRRAASTRRTKTFAARCFSHCNS